MTVHVPVDVLARLGGDEFAWQVPALREELVTALIRSLPKDLRRNFVPAPDTARAVLAELDPGQEPLLARRAARAAAAAPAFSSRSTPSTSDKLPRHLRMTFAVEAAGRHGGRPRQGPAAALQEQLAAPVRRAPSPTRSPASWNATGCAPGRTTWTSCRAWSSARSGGHAVRGYPALVDARRGGRRAGVRHAPASRRAAMRAGTRRLLRLALPSPVKAVERGSSSARPGWSWARNPDGSLTRAARGLRRRRGRRAGAREPAWTRAGVRRAARARGRGAPAGDRVDVVGRVEQVLAAAHEVRLALPAQPPAAQAEAIEDVRAQFRRLLPPGFVTATGRDRLADLTRYLTAVRRRLDRLPRDADTDRARMRRVHAVQDAYDELVRALPASRARAPPDVARHRLADRGAAGEPVGPAARHAAPGQRAAHLPRDRRRHPLIGQPLR